MPISVKYQRIDIQSLNRAIYVKRMKLSCLLPNIYNLFKISRSYIWGYFQDRSSGTCAKVPSRVPVSAVSSAIINIILCS